MNYIEDILSTITEGATSLQMSSQHNIFVVPVKTNMRLLDFDLLDINSKQFKSSVRKYSVKAVLCAYIKFRTFAP